MSRKVLQANNNRNDNNKGKASSKKCKVSSTDANSGSSSSSIKKKSVKPPKPPQHQKRYGVCWARKTNGSVCNEKWAKHQFIPYCRHHLQKGDGAVKVV